MTSELIILLSYSHTIASSLTRVSYSLVFFCSTCWRLSWLVMIAYDRILLDKNKYAWHLLSLYQSECLLLSLRPRILSLAQNGHASFQSLVGIPVDKRDVATSCCIFITSLSHLASLWSPKPGSVLGCSMLFVSIYIVLANFPNAFASSIKFWISEPEVQSNMGLTTAHISLMWA